ncbi:MAG: sulfatase [Myxococcales bacterium]|nr:sulfatase [Myxococcales bacterium]MDH5567015.1 sulfatase [Myxococcales bacterium]
MLIAALLCGGAASCRDDRSAEDARPSFLLVVVDTLRADAVSSYGAVEGTTPHLDALASEGVRYERAYAPAPWTLPSHATIFTGLGPEQHGVGIQGLMVLPDAWITLAERTRDLGYETIGLAENPVLSSPFGFDQGFSTWVAQSVEATLAQQMGQPHQELDVLALLSKWKAARSNDKPFFLFVNLMEPHDPYTVRDVNRFVPDGADPTRVRSGGSGWGVAASAGMCDLLPSRAELEILRGLYLGDVAEADARLGAIHALASQAAQHRPLVTIVTSDHGEHLGEHRLLGHEYSLRNVLLSVPLVVHGLPGVDPGVIDAPVELADIVPSVLQWIGSVIPEDLPGRPLPLSPDAAPSPRTLVAAFTDTPLVPPEQYKSSLSQEGMEDRARYACKPGDRVFGDIISVTRFPFKLIWYETGEPELYDLRWDSRELSDLAQYESDRIAKMLPEIANLRRRTSLAPSAEKRGEVDPRVLEILRSLGYVEDPRHAGPDAP